MTKSRCFSIIGGTIWGNRGAEAMICTVVGMLTRQWPDSRFQIFTYFPSQDAKLVQRSHVRVLDGSPFSLVAKLLPGSIACFLVGLFGIRLPDRWLPREIVALRCSSVLLDVSGISFSDGRQKFLPFNVLCVLPALLLRVPVVKLSQALGPFESLPNRVVARFILSRCLKIFARGASSAHHLASLRLDPSLQSDAADIVFTFEDTFSLSDEGAAEAYSVVESLPTESEGATIVGICPSSVVLAKARRAGVDYVDVLLRLVTDLVTAGRFVVVLPNATRASTKTLRNNDLPVILELKDRCEAVLTDKQLSRVRWLVADVNTESLRRVTATVDVLVTSRFHAMIGALSLQVPTVVIGWSHKYREVLAPFGLEEYCLSFDEGDPARLLAAVESLLSTEFRAGWRAAEYLDAARRSSRHQFEYLAKEFA